MMDSLGVEVDPDVEINEALERTIYEVTLEADQLSRDEDYYEALAKYNSLLLLLRPREPIPTDEIVLVLLKMAYCFKKLEKYEQQVLLACQAVTIDKTNIHGYLSLAEGCHPLGDLERGTIALNKAIEYSAGQAWYKKRLDSLKQLYGMEIEAETEAETSTENNPPQKQGWSMGWKLCGGAVAIAALSIAAYKYFK